MQVTDKEFESDLVQFLEGTGQERLAKNVRGKHVGWCAHSRPTLHAQPADFKTHAGRREHISTEGCSMNGPQGTCLAMLLTSTLFLTLTCSIEKRIEMACLTPD